MAIECMKKELMVRVAQMHKDGHPEKSIRLFLKTMGCSDGQIEAYVRRLRVEDAQMLNVNDGPSPELADEPTLEFKRFQGFRLWLEETGRAVWEPMDSVWARVRSINRLRRMTAPQRRMK